MSNGLHVTVRFGDGVPTSAQGPALLAFEKHLRQITGMDCRVFKERLGDDSKLRIKMTPIERDKL
jgi:hypothetical protein